MNHSPNRNVFVNCPFDQAYAPMWRAIVFTIVDCSFLPRCAMERSDASEVRIQKIYRIIRECERGIHDLSRVELDDETRLPRFNMPLELGIFLGAKFLGGDDQSAKSCLVFDQQPWRYQMYLSDIAGQDISWHSGEPKEVVRLVRDWLSGLTDAPTPTASFVWDHYATFLAELRYACELLRQRPDELTYADLLRHIRDFRLAYAETLTVGNRRPIENPAPAEIKRTVRSIAPTGTKRNYYVVYKKGASGFTYLQALRESEGRWIVEYQDGHLEQHYRGDASLDTEDVVTLFLRYAEASEKWRGMVTWLLIDL
jgi:hypothetical protein